jgi:hypothetical protein
METNNASRPKTGTPKRVMLGLIVLLVIGGGVATGLQVWRQKFGPQGKIQLARQHIGQLQIALELYVLGYGASAVPYTTNALAAAAPDFVFGTFGTDARVQILNEGGDYQANNSEIVSALMSATTFPNGQPSPNADHSLNPNRVKFLYPPKAPDNRSPGLGQDGVFRDPWGNPYIIAFDASCDYVTMSHFKGVEKPPPLPPSNVTGEMLDHSEHFCAQLRHLVWSFGPDGKADPALKVHEGVNADNLYSWR